MVIFVISRAGYEYLGFKYSDTPNDTSFRAGLKEIAVSSLGDPSPTEWEAGFQTDLHALVLIADDDLQRLQQIETEVMKDLQQVANIVQREEGFNRRNEVGESIEHFGFVDGISQPLFLKRDIDKAREISDFSKWDPRAPLNLIVFPDPHGHTEDSYGSYLIYRKLEQDVEGFHGEKKDLADKLGISTELAGAYAIGRFRDGTPVTLENTSASSSIYQKVKRWFRKLFGLQAKAAVATPATNNFNYVSDQEGARCPLHAHTRKSNPRGDTETLLGNSVPLAEEKMHRIARRGMNYETCDPDAQTCGMLFLCFQANIPSQYEFIQKNWVNNKDFVKLKVGQDPVIGQPKETDVKNQQWPNQWNNPEAGTTAFNFQLWVHMKGGEAFFAPSISFLKHLNS